MKPSVITCLIVGILGASLFAASPATEERKVLTPEQQAERSARFKARQYAMTGGIIVKPASQKGKIVIANAQKKMAQRDIDEVVSYLRKETRLDFVCESATGTEAPADLIAGRKAGLVVKVTDIANDPVMLVAPENRWAILNVSGLESGLPENALRDRIFASRCRKELFRTIALLCGGCASMYPDNLTWVASIDELDQYKESMPVDIPDRIVKHIAGLGITPEIRATYKNACRAGWAPPPTNDIQKAIWDEVHQLPTNPLPLVKPTK